MKRCVWQNPPSGLANSDPVPWMAQACAALFREFDRMHILRSELFGADDKFH